MNSKTNTKFYQKNWFVWLSLFIFTPLGIVLLWVNKKYSRHVRIVLSVVFSLLFVFIFVTSDNSENTQQSNVQTNITENIKDNTEATKDKQKVENSESTTSLKEDSQKASLDEESKETIVQADQKEEAEEISTETEQNTNIIYDIATVTRNIDGDTIEVSIAGQKEKVRLIGVNTPETKHPTKGVETYGIEASNFTKKHLYPNREIYLEKDVSDRDRYGRLLRYVWLELPQDKPENELKNKCFNAVLVAEGYAQVATYPPDVKYNEYFLELQKKAKELEKGLWGIEEENQEETAKEDSNTGNTPINSAIMVELSDGKQHTLNPDTKYVGSNESNKYHELTCRWVKKINPENLVQFTSKEDAEGKGYVPCGVCKP